MDPTLNSTYCFVTITDDEFCVATEVLLYSFLKYNPWFAGDVVVIEDGLSEPQRARLERLHPIRFMQPDPRLQDKTRTLRAHQPTLQDVYKRFFSFEVFRLTRYHRVVYFDSDICCLGDVSALFTASAPFMACPDGFTYGDRIQAALQGDAAEPPSATVRYGRRFDESFNAGVLSVAPPVLGEDSYRGLLAMLDVDAWAALGASKFTDQMALNVFFEGRFAPLPAIYNYMIFIEEYQKGWEGIGFADARIIHFAGTIKPWNDYDQVDLARRAPQFFKFIDVWRELLHEARAEDRLAALEAGYRRQKAWIRAYNQEPPKPRGRIT